MEIYPLTITLDRYNGTYSGGKYTAWRLRTWDIPEKASSDDVDCFEFWNYEADGFPVGVGDSPEAAIESLRRKLLQLQTEEKQ